MSVQFFSRVGAAIIPNISRSGPGTRNTDYPEVERGRGQKRGISSAPPGVVTPTSFIHCSYRPRRNFQILKRWGGGLLVLFMLGNTGPLLAQSVPNGETEKSEGPPKNESVETLRPDEPVDLTLEMFLRRQEEDSTLFTRRSPKSPEALRASLLDSLNPQGKEGEITIPLRGYPPPDQPPTPNQPRFIEASIGRHTTADIRAGFSGTTWPFDYHASATFFRSNGFAEQNESDRLNLSLGGGYVIGTGYGIFSGGYMGGSVDLDRYSYRLYAIQNSPQRKGLDWAGEMRGTAEVNGVEFEGRGRLRHLGIDQTIPFLDEAGPQPLPTPDTTHLSETSLEGKLIASGGVIGLDWQGTVDLRLTDATPGSVNFGEAELMTGLETSFFSVMVGGAFGVAGGSDGSNVSQLSPRGRLRIFPFDGVSLAATALAGLRQTTAQNVLRINRYALLEGTLLPEQEDLGYGMILHVEPMKTWGVRLEGSRRTYRSYLHFEEQNEGEFAPKYGAANVDMVDADMYLHIDSRNKIAAIVRLADGQLEGGEALPYVPNWDGELYYSRKLFNIPLTVTGSLRLIGPRQGGTRELDPVFLVGFDWSYAFSRSIELVMESRNLLAQDYELWEGYQEEGLFVSIGLKARF